LTCGRRLASQADLRPRHTGVLAGAAGHTPAVWPSSSRRYRGTAPASLYSSKQASGLLPTRLATGIAEREHPLVRQRLSWRGCSCGTSTAGTGSVPGQHLGETQPFRSRCSDTLAALPPTCRNCQKRQPPHPSIQKLSQEFYSFSDCADCTCECVVLSHF
jgi:hypothetical protein